MDVSSYLKLLISGLIFVSLFENANIGILLTKKVKILQKISYKILSFEWRLTCFIICFSPQNGRRKEEENANLATQYAANWLVLFWKNKRYSPQALGNKRKNI